MNRETKNRILNKLEEMYPEAKAELVFSNPYEMLVATIDNKNCFTEVIPLPVFSVLGVCNFTFIGLK